MMVANCRADRSLRRSHRVNRRAAGRSAGFPYSATFRQMLSMKAVVSC